MLDLLGQRNRWRVLAGPAIGIGLFWTWTLFTGYSLTIFFDMPDAPHMVREVWLCSSWCQALAFVIIAVFAKTIGSLAEEPAMRLGAPLAAAASTVLFPVASFLLGQSSMAGGALSLVAAAIMGASGSCIIIMWAERASAAGARNSMLIMNVSLVLSGLLYFVVSLWPPEAVTVVVSALPCLSGGLLAFGAERLSPAQAQGCDSGSDRGLEPARPHLKILAP